MLTPLVKIMKYQEYCDLILKDVNNSYIALCEHGGLCSYHEGIVQKSSSVLLELSRERVIEVDTASHRLLRVNGEEVNGMEHNQVLSLSDDGERWEGDVLNNQPYGWGVYYDMDNNKVYEGFRLTNVNVCYGRSFFSDIHTVAYEGEWCEGRRWGRGIQYDRNGDIMIDGGWVGDGFLEKSMVLKEENQLLHNHIEELIVNDNICNGREWSVLDLSPITRLRQFRVGDACFCSVKELKIVGLSKLERVVIGQKCFCWSNGCDPTHHFYLKDCDRLRELKIGSESFKDYCVCEIENLPSLEGIEMGELNKQSGNFFNASLELKSA